MWLKSGRWLFLLGAVLWATLVRGAEGLMAYDIARNTWSHLKPKGDGPGDMNTNGAYYEYDPVLDLVVAIHFTSRGKTPGIFIYNPETNSWSDPLPFPPDGPKFNFAANT